MQPLTGLVFNIQRFSTHDGPGIRTTVFLKGCPLRCFWCHNPEGLDPRQEVQFFPERCILCNECVLLCEHDAHQIVDKIHVYDRSRCVQCGKCIDACCSGALEFAGKEMTPEEVFEEVLRDEAFYETSKGGVTISGGEPLLQLNFTTRLLELCKSHGIHTAIETTLYRKWDEISHLVGIVDLFLVDLKIMDTDQHRIKTGNTNQRILDNVRKLAGVDVPVIFHTPVIPSVNDTQEAIIAIARFVGKMIRLRRDRYPTRTDPNISLELLPFHRLASGKYESLGKEYSAKDFSPIHHEELTNLLNAALKINIPVKIR